MRGRLSRNEWLGLLAALVLCVGLGAAYLARGASGDEADPRAQGSPVSLRPAAPTARAAQPADAGPRPHAFARVARAGDTPLAYVPQLAHDARRIAEAHAAGALHAVYIGNDGAGRTCVVLQEPPQGRGGGGCNPERRPFLDSTVLWSSTHYNDVPQKLVVFGVAERSVHGIRLFFPGGRQTAAPLSADGGFLHVVTRPAIQAADVPEAIVTLDARGRVLERVPLGITFGG